MKAFLPDDASGVAVEIGQGSGKYTLEVISKAKQIICLDVSEEFMNIAKKRLSQHKDKNKVSFELLRLRNCNEILNSLEKKNLIGKIDLFFSIKIINLVEEKF